MSLLLCFLELGAGNGDLTKHILKNNTGCIKDYIATEIFEEGVNWLKNKGLETQLIDAQNIALPNNSFDVVLSFDVMHHVDRPIDMAKEMMRVSRGELFLTESNGLSLGRKLKELSPYHRRAGEKSYTPRQYKSFFKKASEHGRYKIVEFQIKPLIFAFRTPRFFLKFLILFNIFIEKIPFLKWQCSNVYIYIKYEKSL